MSGVWFLFFVANIVRCKHNIVNVNLLRVFPHVRGLTLDTGVEICGWCCGMCVVGDRFLRFPLVVLSFRTVEGQVRKLVTKELGNPSEIRNFWQNNVSFSSVSIVSGQQGSTSLLHSLKGEKSKYLKFESQFGEGIRNKLNQYCNSGLNIWVVPRHAIVTNSSSLFISTNEQLLAKRCYDLQGSRKEEVSCSIFVQNCSTYPALQLTVCNWRGTT
jgi:hypothetical protein